MVSKVADEAEPLCYRPIPPHHLQLVVLPLPSPVAVLHRRHHHRWRVMLCVGFFFLLLGLGSYCLWPSKPSLEIARLNLDRIHIRTIPTVSLDITLSLVVKLQNADLYAIDYHRLVVSIGYRGNKLGSKKCGHGSVRARDSSYVEAKLELDEAEVFFDVILLLEDLAKGTVPFETVTEVRGQFEVPFLELPLQTKVSCQVNVNTRNKTIIHENCYHTW